MTSQYFQRKTSMKTSRDIALFERHWAWLSDQPRGISATLHLLVEDASRDRHGKYRAQKLKEDCYFLMRDTAGDRPSFEDASRALFSGDLQSLKELVANWPSEVASKVIAQATEACIGHTSTSDSRRL
ncbi:DUF2239 family protein [Achromobacter sp.]|uniref:DUF2239 family protein n=1 Tax=Achromobacter sp. TaxID=134375 RepID=UPI000EBD8DA2|nr:DUF2239 family protein [Achromobacter sp.]HCW16590.1 hypothetical protein [Achromobacter sp.]